MQIVLYRLGTEVGITHAARENLLGLVVQGAAVMATDMDSPAAVFLITTYLRSSQQHWQAMDAQPSDAVAASWHFGKPILKVAERARAQRRTNAWRALDEDLVDETLNA